MMRRIFKNAHGFTLIELLLVVGMLSLVMGAIYSVYSSHMKTAFSQEEVIDVQQNLRIALDRISRDITMAGIMVPTGTNPIASVFTTYSTNISMNTASPDGRFARVIAVVSGSPITLTVDPPARNGDPNPVDGFDVGSNVRIISPGDGSQPLTGSPNLVVTGKTTSSITLSSNLAPGDVISAGSMLAKTADNSPLPQTVDYRLVNGGTAINGYTCPNNQRCLVRRVNGNDTTAEIVATNLSSLSFSYLDDSYVAAPVPINLTKVRAVQVTLKGATAKTAAFSGGARSRAITSIIKLRNRR